MEYVHDPNLNHPTQESWTNAHRNLLPSVVLLHSTSPGFGLHSPSSPQTAVMVPSGVRPSSHW